MKQVTEVIYCFVFQLVGVVNLTTSN